MNNEILKWKGRLAELKKKNKSLDIEADGLIIIIRDVLDPYTDDLKDIDTEKAYIYADRLHKLRSEYMENLSKIKELSEAIGEE